jgi:hypothetical protein
MQSLSGYGVVNPYADNSGLLYSYNPSDVSLKENIEEYDGGLIAVLALNPVHYDWIDKERFGDRHQIGLIAQEVDPIVPEVVQKNREDDVWGVDYVKLIPVLISAVQELNAKVEAQAAEIAALKGA